MAQWDARVLTSPAPGLAISITSARWGAASGCYGFDTINVVKGWCEGKASCTLTASWINTGMPNTCSGANVLDVQLTTGAMAAS